jgi:hypothetical protein
MTWGIFHLVCSGIIGAAALAITIGMIKGY